MFFFPLTLSHRVSGEVISTDYTYSGLVSLGELSLYLLFMALERIKKNVFKIYRLVSKKLAKCSKFNKCSADLRVFMFKPFISTK